MSKRVVASTRVAGVLVLWALSAACDGPSTVPTALTVSEIAPSIGATGGATRVTITGVGFQWGATVSFGDTATPASVVAPTRIVADAPAHTAGLVDVVVTNPDGRQSTLTAGYRYAPGFTVVGNVTELTEDGPVPVEGVQVDVLLANRRAVTDANGAYAVSGVIAMTSAVSASGPGYLPTSSTLTIAGDTQLDIRLVRNGGAFTLAGTVYELAPTGRLPIEGVLLYCDSCGSAQGHTFVTTDVNGLYRFTWVSNGTTAIQLYGKEGYRYAGPPEHERSGIPIPTNGNTVFDIEFIRR